MLYSDWLNIPTQNQVNMQLLKEDVNLVQKRFRLIFKIELADALRDLAHKQ